MTRRCSAGGVWYLSCSTASHPLRGGGFVVTSTVRANPGWYICHAAAIAFSKSGSFWSTKARVTSLSGSTRSTRSFEVVTVHPLGAVKVAPAGVFMGVSASSLVVTAAGGASGAIDGTGATLATGAGGEGGGAGTGSAPPHAASDAAPRARTIDARRRLGSILMRDA